ncbi:hypothetical protein FTUN_7658 [Frigoriglobus tundricola]|uniref:Uncharacterized protein n=1 Tax=Frigoriglobus tundricola TaxID=2774151 RepID=A0A6M5Z1U7_9BACT|nr:hypothetical protein FTUN_7658 [Frigoriglobus tundricola]
MREPELLRGLGRSRTGMRDAGEESFLAGVGPRGQLRDLCGTG